MTMHEYGSYVKEKLAALADTESNRKKHQKSSELSALSDEIRAKEKAIREAIGAEDYDAAVALKSGLANLEAKREILSEVMKEACSQPDYDRKDLDTLAHETSEFYYNYLYSLYRKRLEILKELDGNYQLMVDAQKQCHATSMEIDEKYEDYDGRTHVLFSIPGHDEGFLMDPWRLERMIKESNRL